MLHKLTIVSLSLSAAIQPVGAATLDPDRNVATGQQTTGAFAGARVRLPLGPDSTVSAGLAFAPIGRSIGNDGAVRMRFGEGLALGFGTQQQVTLTLAGTRVDRLGFRSNGREVPVGDRKGISTVGYVAIGAGLVLVAAFVAYGAIGDAATE
jgi:hypothetical protein